MLLSQITRMKNLYVVSALVLVLGVATALSVTGETQQTSQVRMGAVLSLTGQGAVDAEEMRRGIELARSDLAVRGVIVDVVYEDDGTDTKSTVAAFEKLASVDQVDFVVGPTWSFLGDAAQPVIERTQMPTFAPALTSEYATPGQHILFGSLKNSERRASIAEWLREQGVSKVALVVDNGTWGLSILPAFEAAARDTGVEVVHVAKVQPFAQDPALVSVEISKAKSAGAEAILMSGYEGFVTEFLTTSQEMNFRVPTLITQQFVFGLPARGALTLTDADQLYVSYAATSEAFAEKYEAVYGTAPGEYADRAYDGVMLMVERELTGKTEAYKGFAGDYTFDERGDIVGGEWVIRPVVE